MKNIFLTLLLFSGVIFAQSKKELKTINNAINDISMEVDKFDKTITWRSPSFGKGIAATTAKRVKFIRTKSKDGMISTYIRLLAYGSTLNVGENGFILLFQDGTRIEKPNAKVDVNNDAGTAYWEYTIFERLSEDELEMFATKKIDSYRLYIYEGRPITKKSVLQVMGYAKGIQKING